MQEHYCLADRVSEAKASRIFNNVACKVIKNAFKHACCISVATYYTQVNLLLFLHASVEVIVFPL
jgi:hypothetical protein